MMKSEGVVIDSYAWIEYFKGSEQGRKVAPHIEGGHGLTSFVVVAELSAYYAHEKMEAWQERYRFIESKSAILELTLEIAKAAGRTRQEMRKERPKFGLIDALIYETAKSLKATVISGDPHFEGLPNVIFLKD